MKHLTIQRFPGMFRTPLALAVAAFVPAFAHGASFQLLEQSPAQLGKAFAGTGTDISDASTVYFNPAGMTRLERLSLTAGANLVATQADFEDRGSTYPGGEGDTDEYSFIPNLYAVAPLGDRLAIGFGVNAPFGLVSEFDEQWVGRYSATDSELEMVNVNATTAWAVSEALSLGLGVNYQRVEATLENQVDSTVGLAPDPATDSSATIKGDDDDFVLDFSVLFEPDEMTRLSLLWRQGGDFTLSGDARFDYNPACSPGAGSPTGAPPAPTTGTLCAGALNMREGSIEARLELPDTITVSLTRVLNERWQLHADIAQTRWSSIRNIRVINTENDVPVDELDLQYDDTMRYALGTSFQVNDAWTWRAGVAFDEAPQSNPAHVSARIPDGDRTWLSAGLNWAPAEHLSIDFSYAHLFVDEVSLLEVDDTGRQLSGRFDSSVDLLGVQLNWQF